MTVSKEQRQVITHTQSPALVLAGPGSGKTLVVIKRLQQLLEQFPSAKIVNLTFSKAAALEMETRFINAMGQRIPDVHFATVHSLSYSILQKGWQHGKSPLLLESKDCPYTKHTILHKIYQQINGTEPQSQDMEKLISCISRVQNLASDSKTEKSELPIKNFEKINSLYINYKQEHNIIDFDDMIRHALDTLQHQKEQREAWGNRYDFIQVDEAQDLTVPQFEIIKLLAPHHNIVIVADDDQSIYGFRGANPKNIMKFEQEMKNCQKYILNDNFRCAPEIVNLASRVITHNRLRFPKELRAQNTHTGKIYFLHAKNSLCQAKFITDSICNSKRESCGVLYRNNTSSFVIALVLICCNISFQISGGDLGSYMDYINLFFAECLKQGYTGCKASTLYKQVVNHNFTVLCKRKENLTRQNDEAIKTTVDFLYAAFNLCRSLNEVRTLLQKLTKACETGKYQGTDFQKKDIFLSTIHSAKGLEYDAVYLIDLNKDEFPGKSAAAGALLEEERRLFYVGITRARYCLYLMFAENHGLQPAEESIFYREALAAHRLGGKDGSNP